MSKNVPTSLAPMQARDNEYGQKVDRLRVMEIRFLTFVGDLNAWLQIACVKDENNNRK